MKANLVLIDALYIADKGGGPTLLDYIIEEIIRSQLADSFEFLFDERFVAKRVLKGIKYETKPAGILQRVSFYLKNRHKYDVVLCFANIPPPFKLGSRTYTYFQNIRFLESASSPFHKGNRLFYIKFLFIKYFSNFTDYFIVQSKHTANELVKSRLAKAERCLILPIFKESVLVESLGKTRQGFVFISTPSPHKNHINLIRAWEDLYDRGYTPLLHLTVDDSRPDLIEEIRRLQGKGVNITNHGYTNPHSLYAMCNYAIYPSYSESFGLGLIEASNSGLKIIAADLPYVHAVITPSITFDPHQVSSIVDAVLEAIKRELPAPKLLIKNEISTFLNLLKSG